MVQAQARGGPHMSLSVPRISLDQVRRLPKQLIHPGQTTTQADLYSLFWKGQQAVLKDYGDRPLWLRWLWCRRVLKRECKALSNLSGFSGVPRLLALVGPDAFLMQLLPGRRIDPACLRDLPLEFHNRASALTRALHSAGVAHGDIHPGNFLVVKDTSAFLIDFATAMRSTPGWSGILSRQLFRLAAELDQYWLASLKRECYPESLSAEEVLILQSPPLIVTLARTFRLSRLRQLLESPVVRSK